MENQDRGNLNQPPKTIIGFLVVAGIITIILGFWQLNNYLKTPFIVSYQTSLTDLREKLAQIKSTTASKFTDTDHDGLTDYDELNIYKTSPYLEDSDSDGIKDGDEALKGSNPNCPAGQQCLAEINTNINYNVIVEDLTATEQELLAQTIRQVLMVNGVSEEELSQIDDATLIQMYNELTASPEGQDLNQSLSASSNINKEGLANYNLEQIKQFLMANGMSEEDLELIPDDQLLSSWQEILNTL